MGSNQLPNPPIVATVGNCRGSGKRPPSYCRAAWRRAYHRKQDRKYGIERKRVAGPARKIAADREGEFIQAWTGGLKMREMAEQFGVTDSTIDRMVTALHLPRRRGRQRAELIRRGPTIGPAHEQGVWS